MPHITVESLHTHPVLFRSLAERLPLAVAKELSTEDPNGDLCQGDVAIVFRQSSMFDQQPLDVTITIVATWLPIRFASLEERTANIRHHFLEIVKSTKGVEKDLKVGLWVQLVQGQWLEFATS